MITNNHFTKRVMAKIQARIWLRRLRNVLAVMLAVEAVAVLIELAGNNVDLFPRLVLHDSQLVTKHFPAFLRTLGNSLPWLGLASLLLTAGLYLALRHYETIIGRNRITGIATKGEFRMPLAIMNSTKRLVTTGAALALVLGSASAFAVIDNSHHQAAVHASQTAYVKSASKDQSKLAANDSAAASQQASGSSTLAVGANSSTGASNPQSTAPASHVNGSAATSVHSTTPVLAVSGVYGHLLTRPFSPHCTAGASCDMPTPGKVRVERYIQNNADNPVELISVTDVASDGAFRITLGPGLYRLTGENTAGNNHTASVNVQVSSDTFSEASLYFDSLMR